MSMEHTVVSINVLFAKRTHEVVCLQQLCLNPAMDSAKRDGLKMIAEVGTGAKQAWIGPRLEDSKTSRVSAFPREKCSPKIWTQSRVCEAAIVNFTESNTAQKSDIRDDS